MHTVNRRTVSSHTFVRRALATTTILSVVLIVLPVPVCAQRYKVVAPKIEIKASKTLRGQVSTAMGNDSALQGGGKKVIDRYFNAFYFPMMTQTSDTDLARLGKLREGLFKRFLRGSGVPAAKTHLTNTTFKFMHVIARDNYHPAVRYNATLILGMLDQTYPAGGSDQTPPVVLPAGTNELLELLEQSEIQGVKVHPSVQVGALEGLERHARFGIDAQYKDRVSKAALAMIAQNSAGPDVDEDVNNWMKCQAARVLVRQFKAGPNQEVQAALTKMIANDKMSIEDRCCIVGLLGKMKYAGAAEADVAATVVPLGQLTQAVVDEGAEQAKDFEDLVLGNNPGGLSRRGVGRGGPQGPKLERRQLLSRLKSIASGANSLSEALPADQKQKMQSLTALLSPVISTSASTRALDLDVTGEVIKLKNTMDTLIASWQPAPSAEAVDADFAE